MSRLPIRLRLTLVFAGAMVAVLAGTAVFVGIRLREDLDEGVTATLEGRAAAPVAPTSEPEETFFQVLTHDGRVVRAAGGARRAALTAGEARTVAGGERLLVDRAVPGLEGTVRVLAVRAEDGRVVATGQSLGDRDEALGGLLASFAVGGPVAVLIAALLGYALATAALRPVEGMRRRAQEVSLAVDDHALLPLPDAHDEVRRLGETLNAMLARLRISFERERRFVADASHELRTPIAVVKTELEGVLRAADLPSSTRESLHAALAETDVLAQLAEDLLVLARAGDGALPVRLERIDAREVLDRVVVRFADRAARENRTIEVRAPAGLAFRADPLRLRQAVGNLLDNALRHGSGTIVLAAARADGAIELCVRDGGPGVPDDLGDRAFERFARGDAARTRGGSGLGLAIVRAIAEAHGGSADVVPGASATVCLRLPG